MMIDPVRFGIICVAFSLMLFVHPIVYSILDEPKGAPYATSVKVERKEFSDNGGLLMNSHRYQLDTAMGKIEVTGSTFDRVKVGDTVRVTVQNHSVSNPQITWSPE